MDSSLLGQPSQSLTQILGQRRKRQEVIQKIEPKLFNPERFAIMKILFDLREAEFRDIQSDLGLTAGNLASHFRALERLKLVAYTKDFVGRRQRTIYRLTPDGVSAFKDFVRVLKESLQDVGDVGV
jgi:DNA-binding MarR family transcriptional regulator